MQEVHNNYCTIIVPYLLMTSLSIAVFPNSDYTVLQSHIYYCMPGIRHFRWRWNSSLIPRFSLDVDLTHVWIISHRKLKEGERNWPPIYGYGLTRIHRLLVRHTYTVTAWCTPVANWIIVKPWVGWAQLHTRLSLSLDISHAIMLIIEAMQIKHANR